MTQYQFEAFKWSGTYYNAVYNTSYTATFEDDDAAYEGQSDSGEKISIDGGAFGSSAHQPYAINVDFTDTGGASHEETFYFFNTGSSWYFTPGPGSDFTVGAHLGTYQSHTVGWDYAEVACFAAGTLIETDRGARPVETLSEGDLVAVEGGGLRAVRKCRHRRIGPGELSAHPRLRPVRIGAGALGQGLPRRDLLVSRQHRMLVRSAITRRMFGADEVLIPALRLTALPGIETDQGAGAVTYCHLLLDGHHLLFAEGAPSESLLPGGRADASPDPGRRTDPVSTCRPAVPIPAPALQKRLIDRHTANRKPLLTPISEAPLAGAVEDTAHPLLRS